MILKLWASARQILPADAVDEPLEILLVDVEAGDDPQEALEPGHALRPHAGPVIVRILSSGAFPQAACCSAARRFGASQEPL